MVNVTLFALAFFAGVFLQWFFTWKISRPQCLTCQNKAYPHISLALVKQAHRADRYEEALRVIRDESLSGYAYDIAVRALRSDSDAASNARQQEEK